MSIELSAFTSVAGSATARITAAVGISGMVRSSSIRKNVERNIIIAAGLPETGLAGSALRKSIDVRVAQLSVRSLVPGHPAVVSIAVVVALVSLEFVFVPVLSDMLSDAGFTWAALIAGFTYVSTIIFL